MTKYVTGMKVPPYSRRNLRAIAENVHKALHYDGVSPFPVVKVVELVLPKLIPDFEFQVVSRVMLDEEHGRTYPDKHLMYIREDVYEGACRGRGRDRFTIAHELSHQLIHEGIDVSLARSDSRHKTYEDSEWQANALAGELLMPFDSIRNLTVNQIANTYQVSLAAARTQLKMAS